MPRTMGRVRVGTFALILLASGVTACSKSPTAPTPQPPAEAPLGTAAAIFLTPASWDLPANGGSLELVIATSANDVGSVVAANVPVTLSASSGELTVSELRTDSTGHARTTWSGTRSATITARAGDALGTSTIRVANSPAPPPNPNPNPNPNPGPAPDPAPGPQPAPTPPPPSNGVSVFWASTPASPIVGEPATFTATVTSRPEAPVASYAWDFNEDGVTDATSATPTQTFTRSGRIGVSLTVTLVDDRTATDGGGLDVRPSPTPAIVTTLSATPNTVAPGDGVTFTATATPNSSAGTVTSYDWDFDNNGTVERTTITPTTSIAYTTIGTKTAKVTAKSATASGSATTPIVVSAPALTITSFRIIVPAGGATSGDVVTFEVIVNSASLPTTLSYAWDFDGDDVTNETTPGGPTKTIDHIYNEPKKYTVNVTVTAPDGRTVKGTAQVTIAP